MWQQEGIVLLLALVFVLLLALIAGMIVQSGTLQLHMAGNDQYREEASQTAQAIAAEISLHPENFSLAATVGHVRCAPGATDPDCASTDLQGLGSGSVASGYEIDYRVTRREPLLWEDTSPRGAPPGAPGVDVGIFEIDVRVEGVGSMPGRARVIQGVAVPVSGESGADPVESPSGGEGNLYRVYWREPGVDPL
jgi:hypothetical protein